MSDFYIDHLSASQLDMFTICPEQWRRRHIEDDKIPPGIAAHTGTAVHQTAEGNFKQKIHSQQDQPLDILKDAAATAYDKSLKKQGVFIAPGQRSTVTKDLGEGKDVAVSLCTPFANDFAPEIQPAMIEKRVVLTVPDLPNILGFIDIYTVDGRLSDMKTAKKKWTEKRVKTATQPTLYREMIKQETGEYPKLLTIDQLVKTKNPYYECASTTRQDGDWEKLQMRFRLMTKQIQAGLFPPAEPDHWKCDPKWCGYWWTCKFIPEHRKRIPNV